MSPTQALASAPLRIVWLDEWIVAASKPSGLLVHRDQHHPDAPALLQQLRDQIGRHLVPVHRLDRSTSGIVVYAFARAVAGRLQAALSATGASKRYLALVRGNPPATWTEDRPLAGSDGRSRAAVTYLRRLARFPDCALVEATLDTGRWHQIRLHLAHAGHHISGDTAHGKARDNRRWARIGLRRPFLHAHALAFDHPETSERLRLLDPLPRELVDVLARIAGRVRSPQ